MAEKRYYWLKLKENFFKSKEIKKLRSMAGGDTYTIVYLEMTILAMKTEGVLTWEGIEESFEAELALELDENVEDIKMTVYYLQSKGLLEIMDSEHYFLPDAIKNTGSETDAAERMRKSRAKVRARLQDCNNVTLLLHPCDTEKEKDIDLENIPPIAPQGAAGSADIWDPDAFNAFWALYPKKKDKVKAIREWNKLKADRKLMKRMGAALKTQIASEEWQRDNGRAIPYPCRWLSHRRWEDQIDAAADVRNREEALPEWI